MNKELLEKLMVKLVTKPVYRTINKVLNGKATLEEELKGMYSLAVHVVIEIEQGSNEYTTLLREIQGKINALYAKYMAGVSEAVPT
jgi:hypothetical protein